MSALSPYADPSSQSDWQDLRVPVHQLLLLTVLHRFYQAVHPGS